MRIALQVGALARSPLQFGVCLRPYADYLANDVGLLYKLMLVHQRNDPADVVPTLICLHF